ncbi:hypothetical protein [Saccharopolyspora cebuensis]|uniref:Excreted virulence factor EspC, type VII ESX diderm n=1 Tax=Saccharopolyspora cebuensis TaxID=418759 RepID=A0ABV4CF30_9PSEU
MTGVHADPGVLEALASKLRNASDDLESGAAPPPDVEAGVVTGAVTSALALLTDGLGNISTGIASVADATAESRALYVETDYEQATALRAAELDAEQPG